MNSYQIVCGGKSYDREGFAVLESIAIECRVRVESVSQAIACYENPAETLARATGMKLPVAQLLLSTIKRRDAANRAALAKPPARPALKVAQLPALKVAQLPAPPPRHGARHAPTPAQSAKVSAAMERNAVVSTSAQHQKRQAEAARTKR